MAALEQMLKKDLVKLARELQQENKLLKKQTEEKRDESGEIKGDIKVPVFYIDQTKGPSKSRFITAIANVNLNQLSDITDHGNQRHMAEFDTIKYCEDILFDQRLEKGE